MVHPLAAWRTRCKYAAGFASAQATLNLPRKLYARALTSLVQPARRRRMTSMADVSADCALRDTVEASAIWLA